MTTPAGLRAKVLASLAAPDDEPVRGGRQSLWLQLGWRPRPAYLLGGHPLRESPQPDDSLTDPLGSVGPVRRYRWLSLAVLDVAGRLTEQLGDVGDHSTVSDVERGDEQQPSGHQRVHRPLSDSRVVVLSPSHPSHRASNVSAASSRWLAKASGSLTRSTSIMQHLPRVKVNAPAGTESGGRIRRQGGLSPAAWCTICTLTAVTTPHLPPL